jgi:hypothetical protein
MEFSTPKKSTPKNRKPVEFGSPNSLRRPVPHIVFLVASKTENVELALLRTLLYFHFHVTPSFTWGYHFLEKQGSLLGKRLPVSKQMLNINPETLFEFRQQLQRNDEPNNFTIDHLIDCTRQVIVQAPWNNGPVVAFQSPLKRQDANWKNWRGSIKIRNYFFILGSLPRGLEGLNDLVGTTNPNVLSCLSHLNEKFLFKELWMDLMKDRIGLYWLDVSADRNISSEVYKKLNLARYH